MSGLAKVFLPTIAKSLSPSQRHALLWLPSDGSERVEDGMFHGLRTSLYALRNKTLDKNIEARLAANRNPFKMENGRWLPSYWRLTDLGMMVQKAISE